VEREDIERAADRESRSVGLQDHELGDPEHPSMQTGSPDGRCALIESHAGRWSAQLVTVPYPTRPVVELANRNGRPDWATALATGYFSPPTSLQKPFENAAPSLRPSTSSV